MNLCTLLGHKYQQVGYSYEWEYGTDWDVDSWCDRCEDVDSNTVPLFFIDLKYKLLNAFRNLRSSSRRPPV